MADESAVAAQGVEVAEQPWPNCPMCDAAVSKGEGPKVSIPNPTISAHAMIACSCGLISKLFDNMTDLRTWWFTRGGDTSGVVAVTTEDRREPHEDF